jgi:hypothetical protein
MKYLLVVLEFLYSNAEKFSRKFVLAFLVFSLLFAGCAQEQPPAKEAAPAELCIAACQKALAEGKSLESGPCLLDPIAEAPSWVCDVAHSPREAVDNEQANQCASFRRGEAKHFVEVAPSCQFIRAY